MCQNIKDNLTIPSLDFMYKLLNMTDISDTLYLGHEVFVMFELTHHAMLVRAPILVIRHLEL